MQTPYQAKYPVYTPQQQQNPYGLPPVAGSAAMYAPPPVPAQEAKKPEEPKTKSWIWLALLAVLLCGAIALVVFLVSRGKGKKGSISSGRKKVSFEDDDDEDEDPRRSRGGPPVRGGRRPPHGANEANYERPIRRPTPAEIHHRRMVQDTHRDSMVRSVSGRSDRLRPEVGYEDAYPETNWRGGSGNPNTRLVEQPDGSFKLPPDASIPLPDETATDPVSTQPAEPEPAPVGGTSSTLATPIEPGAAPPTASGQPTPVADAFSTPIVGA
jgi:hypothetical protein